MGVLAGIVATEVRQWQTTEHYTVGHDGHFSDCEARSCDEDSDAIDWTRKLVTDSAIELWCGERFVARIEPKPK